MNKASQLPSNNYFTNFIVYFSVTLWHILYMIKLYTKLYCKTNYSISVCNCYIFCYYCIDLYKWKFSIFLMSFTAVSLHTDVTLSSQYKCTRIPINQYTLHTYTLRWTQMYNNSLTNLIYYWSSYFTLVICACVNKVLLPDYFKSTISIFFSFN